MKNIYTFLIMIKDSHANRTIAIYWILQFEE